MATLVEYKGANIYQQDEKPVLADVNFHVEEGEFIYIIGRVGSGKSSLLKTIYCELDIDEAQKAEVFGQDLLRLKRKHVPALRRQMGVIFQDFQLLGDRTIYKNLRFVLRATGWRDKKRINKRIEEVLTDVGMEDKAQKMPHELSGGEQQRIAIARAMLNKPRMIVADEPTGNLDPETAENIIQLLRHVVQTGTAVIMSTHNMPLLDKYPGIVYRCADGTMAEVTNDYNRMAIDCDDEIDPAEPQTAANEPAEAPIPAAEAPSSATGEAISATGEAISAADEPQMAADEPQNEPTNGQSDYWRGTTSTLNNNK